MPSRLMREVMLDPKARAGQSLKCTLPGSPVQESPAEAALPVPIGAQRAQEVDLAKVRPVDLGEIELAVGALPEQEARQSQLAAGADAEVRIRELRDRPAARRVGTESVSTCSSRWSPDH